MNHCCDLMEKAVEAEGTRLNFDPICDEYNLAVLDGFEFSVSYCPFCGAKTRESKASQYFTSVSEEEEARILAMVVDCVTRTDLLNKLGEPDKSFPKIEDFDRIWKRPISSLACVLYTNLSETAELRITFEENGIIAKKAIMPRCNRT